MHKQVMDTLINQRNTEILLGLERIKQVLSLLGNPQNSYKVVHITGTNGKGSVAAFLECGLHKAGYKVGKFTSPHIKTLNETIRYNLNQIGDTDIEHWYFKVADILDKHQLKLTQFELLTTIMFAYFAQQQIDYLILEVGMGGENDATNVIDKPECVVITNIGLEHTKWFGNTLAAIAHEKSGIIKNNCPVIIADNGAELLTAVSKKSATIINVLAKYSLQVKLNFTNFTTELKFTDNDIKPTKQQVYTLGLFGGFQARNFLCAYEVLKLLKINDEAISYSAQNTTHAGRLQVISTTPLIVADATHNQDGARVLYQTISQHYLPHDVVIVTSILRDKNIAAMLDYFSQIANTIVVTSLTSTDRGLLAEDLLKIATSSRANSHTHLTSQANIASALEYAKTLNKKLILITGSLYLLQEL